MSVLKWLAWGWAVCEQVEGFIAKGPYYPSIDLHTRAEPYLPDPLTTELLKYCRQRDA